MTYVVAIANEKGGVAKTTTTLSLGAAMVERRQEVLLVDLDPQANMTLALGLKAQALDRTIADALLGDRSVLQMSRETALPGLDLVPANHELTFAERYLAVRDGFEFLLRRALEPASSYDAILIDCPPSVGILTQSALAAANLLIIPTQPEYFSAHALRAMLDLIRITRQRSNPRLRYRLLLTMVDQRNRIHRTLLDQIRTAFGQAVFNTVIEIDTRLRESPLVGQPITTYAPTSRAAQQYRELSQELSHYVEETVGTPQQSA